MILIFSRNILSSENEVSIETFKSSKSLFNWFNDETTRHCRDWFEMLKIIDEKSFREYTNAIWRDTNTLISFNWMSKASKNLSITMIFVNVKKTIDDVY